MEVTNTKKSKWKRIAVGAFAVWFLICAIRVLIGA